MENGLCLQQLRYGAEVRAFSEVPAGNAAEVKPAELDLALQLLKQSTSERFEPDRYRDSTLERFQEVLQKKVEGETISAPSEAPPPKVIDLMEALKASLSKSGSGKAGARDDDQDEAQPAASRRGGRTAANAPRSAKAPAIAADEEQEQETTISRRGPARAARGDQRRRKSG